MITSEANLRRAIRSCIVESSINQLRVDRLILEDAQAEAQAFIADMQDIVNTVNDTLEDAQEAKEDGTDEEETKEELKDALIDAENTLEELSFMHGSLLTELERKPVLKEGLGVTLGISIALAAPKVVEWVVAGIAEVMVDIPKIEKHHGHTTVEYNNIVLKYLQKAAEAVHGAYVKLCELAIRGAFKAKQAVSRGRAWFQPADKRREIHAQLEIEQQEFEKKIAKFSKRLFLLIVAIFAVISGAGAIKALGTGHQGLAMLEAVLGTIKSIETEVFLGKVAVYAVDLVGQLMS
jgi:hypothetical protein